MKFSFDLLKQFVKINVPAQKLGELLTEHSLEVEEVRQAGENFSGIVAAKVVAIEKHPNADRLRVIRLEIDNRRMVYPIVCGAWNFKEGDMVALALPGARIARNIHATPPPLTPPTEGGETADSLPLMGRDREEYVLGKATIRGVESQGMICAEFELGLSDGGPPSSPPPAKGGREGVMILDPSVKPGTPLNDLFGLNDYQLNCALPANRPDLHSHMGLGLEIAAVLNSKTRGVGNGFKPPPYPVSKNWKVKIRDKTLCPRYYGVRMNEIVIKPSPKFIEQALKAMGLRPINNVVDITNFVMIELGQPTHAYDAARVKGNIYVRYAKNGEKFLAINHKEYGLTDRMFVIADEEKAIALGGLIGGLSTEITENTKEIVLEVANFAAGVTRRSSKALGLRTDGSAIWEKGVSPKLAALGIARSIELLEKYANANVREFAKFEAPLKNPPAIKFTAGEINKLLGTNLKPAEISKYLGRYGVEVKKLSATSYQLQAVPPWWRSDITSMPDLAEEVLKLYGYNRVKPQALAVIPSPGEEKVAESRMRLLTDDVYRAKSLFARLGYAEVQNYNFVSEKDIVNFGGNPKDHIQIANPLSEDQRYLKKYPLIPILKNIALNQKHFGDFKIFEVGKQYFGFENEPLVLLAAAFSKTDATEKLVMEIKAAILEFLRTIGLPSPSKERGRGEVVFEQDEKAPWLHLRIGNGDIGGVGYVDENLAQKFEVKGNTAFAKLELEKIFAKKKTVLFKPINKFPKVERDISIIIDDKLKWSEIELVIRSVAPSPLARGDVPSASEGQRGRTGDAGIILQQISLFEAPFLASDKDSRAFHLNLQKQGKKNLGIRLSFESFTRTLTDAEVAGIMDKIVVKLQQELRAEVR